MDSKRLLFHCEFCSSIGWGHVVRCSALAQSAKDAGHSTTLYTTSEPETLPPEIRSSFDSVESSKPTREHNLLILDNPHYGKEQIAPFWPIASKPTVVIDDEGDRDLGFASAIVNPLLHAGEFDYPQSSIHYLGPDYTLLRAAFSSATLLSPEKRESIVVTLGGTDVLDLIPRILNDLSQSAFRQKKITVIGSGQPQSHSQIKDALNKLPHAEWIPQATAEQIASHFAQAHCAITACGGTLYELAACQVPFVGIIVAENQKRFARAINKQWGYPILRADELDTEKLISAIESFNNHSPSANQVNAQGAHKLIKAIETDLLADM